MDYSSAEMTALERASQAQMIDDAYIAWRVSQGLVVRIAHELSAGVAELQDLRGALMAEEMAHDAFRKVGVL